jgi:membrane dipeptidase
MSVGLMRSLLPLVVLSSLSLACAQASSGGGGTQEDPALRRARDLLKRSILIDGHNDLPWEIRNAKGAPRDVVAYDLRKTAPGQTDFARIAQGGLGGQFWSVYIPGDDKEQGWAKIQLEQIDIARRMIALYPDKLGLALSADDVERTFKSGRVASLIGMEGGHAIENSLGALRAYYDIGARYMTLTHNSTIDWADSATDEAKHGGLTRFGEEVVREMNRLGMLIDLSHTSPGTMDDALRVSEAPVIFSHSSARALCDVPRNVPDDMLKRLAENRGVVMIVFASSFISQETATAYAPIRAEYLKRIKGVSDAAERDRIYKELRDPVTLPKATLAQVADHIEHARKVAGVDHIGIGSDYDGGIEPPVGLEDVSTYPNLFAELIRRGWSDEDLEKLAGKNVLRALREAEAVARRLQSSRPASTATIEELDRAPLTAPPALAPAAPAR